MKLSPISTKAALLQALLQGDGHGFDLLSRIKKATKGQIELATGGVYPALCDLEQDDLIKIVLPKVETKPSKRGGRPSTNYALTAAGKKMATTHKKALAALIALPSP